MLALAIAGITFICTFGSAWGFSLVRPALPPSSMSKESQDVVRLGMGLVATMTALLLGLVTASAKGSFDAQDNALRTSAANILSLDRLLARYGPETRPARALLREVVEFRVQSLWSSGDAPSSPSAGSGEAIEDEILALSPATESQRWFKSQALNLTQEVLKTRWRILGAGEGNVPRVFLLVVIFWLTATFASFGLYAPRNSTVIGVLLIAAVSVAAAVFLILELDGPFTGLIRIPSGPLRYTLEHLGQ